MFCLEKRFSKWYLWDNRNNIANIEYPGIYCISITDANLSQVNFSFINDIQYIGMSNSLGGVKKRLNQFDSIIKNKSGKHSGAKHIIADLGYYNTWNNSLYVAVYTISCKVAKTKRTTYDLMKMGKVAHLEYIAIAEYKKHFNYEPKYNVK